MLCLLFLLGYLSGVTFLYLFYKYKREFETVTYVDTLTWPFQRQAFRERMGEYFIERAMDHLNEGDFLDAYHFLRAGVARAKANLEGRKLLAEFYEFGLRRPDLAGDLLVDGLPYAEGDALYLRDTLAVYMRNQLDEEIQDTVSEILTPGLLLPEPELGDGASNPDLVYFQTAAFFSARSHFYRGNYDQAEDLIKEFQLEGTRDGLFLTALINWERGRHKTAISQLEAGISQFPQVENFYVHLARYYREMGDYESARRTSVLRIASNPLNPIPRIELLYAYREEGNTEREIAEVEALLRQFSADERTLQFLANFAAETGQPDLAHRLYIHALEKGFDISSFALLVIESQIVAEHYSSAIDFAEELMEENPDWLNARLHIFNSLRSVAYLGAGDPDLGQLYLNEFIKAQNSRVETFLAVAKRLQSIGLPEESREVLRIAWESNPDNQAALSALIALDIELNQTDDLPVFVRQLLTMRRPSYRLIEEAYYALSSDRFFFSEERETLLIELQAILSERNVT